MLMAGVQQTAMAYILDAPVPPRRPARVARTPMALPSLLSRLRSSASVLLVYTAIALAPALWLAAAAWARAAGLGVLALCLAVQALLAFLVALACVIRACLSARHR